MSQEILSNLKEFILEQNNKQTDKLIGYIDSRITEVEKVIQIQAEKNEKLEEELKQVKDRNKTLERQLRKNSIIIHNLDYLDGDLLTFTTNKLNEVLKLSALLTQCDINNIYTVGRSNENKPIIIQFVRYLTKQKIFKHCKNLRGSNIRISDVLTEEEREERKILVSHLKEAKEENLKAHIYGNKLYIESKQYTARELEKRSKANEKENKVYQQLEGSVPNAGSDSEINKEYREEEQSARGKRKAMRSSRFQKPIFKKAK